MIETISKVKLICPCCLDREPRWLYKANAMWYCVACVKSVFGMTPARFYRKY